MNAHTEHTATLARVIADDAQCQCTGACRNGREACTCGLGMPSMPAEACTELGSYLDHVPDPTGSPWTVWELIGAVGLVAALALACWVPYPL